MSEIQISKQCQTPLDIFYKDHSTQSWLDAIQKYLVMNQYRKIKHNEIKIRWNESGK